MRKESQPLPRDRQSQTGALDQSIWPHQRHRKKKKKSVQPTATTREKITRFLARTKTSRNLTFLGIYPNHSFTPHRALPVRFPRTGSRAATALFLTLPSPWGKLFQSRSLKRCVVSPLKCARFAIPATFPLPLPFSTLGLFCSRVIFPSSTPRLSTI